MSYLKPGNPDGTLKAESDYTMQERLHIAQQIADVAKEQLRMRLPVDTGALETAIRFIGKDEDALLSAAKALLAQAKGAAA
jgi:hypothetical protein